MIQITRILAFFCTMFLLFAACSSEDGGEMEENIPSDFAFEGSFVPAAHPTSGIAGVDHDRSALFLTNFKTDNGPDLNIYLVTDLSSVENEYIDLGDIKGLNGNYSYDLPGNVDFTEHKYVVVWCIAATVSFGHAELEAL